MRSAEPYHPRQVPRLEWRPRSDCRRPDPCPHRQRVALIANKRNFLPVARDRVVITVAFEQQLLAVLAVKIHSPDAALSLQFLLENYPSVRSPNRSRCAALSRDDEFRRLRMRLHPPNARDRVLLHSDNRTRIGNARFNFPVQPRGDLSPDPFEPDSSRFACAHEQSLAILEPGQLFD